MPQDNRQILPFTAGKQPELPPISFCLERDGILHELPPVLVGEELERAYQALGDILCIIDRDALPGLVDELGRGGRLVILRIEMRLVPKEREA